MGNCKPFNLMVKLVKNTWKKTWRMGSTTRCQVWNAFATRHQKVNLFQQSNTKSEYQKKIIVHVAGTYEYVGCYEDKASPKMLEKKQIFDDNSPEKCAKFCQPESGSYWYFALQYGKYCYCGNSLQHQTKKPEKDCWTTCPGDPSKKCGGSYRNSLYRFTNLKHVG